MKLVMACGCFDLLHAGHIRHLMAARALGDELLVVVTSDRQVSIEKGPGRPVLSADERVAILWQLRCVDRVAVNRWPDAVNAIRECCPMYYVKGKEYEGRETPALKADRKSVV